MAMSTCSSCRTILRSRLRAQILDLERQRRAFHNTPNRRSSRTGSYISSQYVDTVPPTKDQLSAAAYFFNTHTPSKAWTASEWRKHISQHSDNLGDMVPEVAFLGRSNSGKSSLLNAVLNSPGLCRVGSRPGKTITMHAWTLCRSDNETARKKRTWRDQEPKLTVLDMPGYGHGSRTEWGQDIIKYLRRRRQFRRAFILLNPKHGIKSSDEQILQVLRAEGIAHQIVASKCDETKASEIVSRMEGLRQEVTQSAVEQHSLGLALSDVLAVGNVGDGKLNQKVESRYMKGVDDVRWAILQTTGLDQYASEQYAESLRPSEDRRPLRIFGSSSSSHDSLDGAKSVQNLAEA